MLSSHVSRMNNIGLEKVRAKVRQLNLKFNTIQNLLNAMMAKLGTPMSRVATTPSHDKHRSNVEKEKLNSCRSLSSLAHSRLKTPISKALEFSGVVERLIVVGAQNLSRCQKASSRHEDREHI